MLHLIKNLTVFSLMISLIVALPSSSQALNIMPSGALGDLDGNMDGGAGEAAVLQAAIAYWNLRITQNRNFNLTVVPMSLTGSTLGTGFVSMVDGMGVPTDGQINIDNDGSTNWYVDPNPFDALEFTPDANSDWRYTGGPGGSDLMAVLVHEIGHASGWICGASCGFTNPNYELMMNPAPGSFVLGPTCVAPFPLLSQTPPADCVFLQDPAPPSPALNAPLRGDGLGAANTVVNELSHTGISGDLMLGFLSGGTRELQSRISTNMFAHAYGDTVDLPPIANAGSDVIVECNAVDGTDFILDGSGSADLDTLSLLYDWSCPGVALSDPSLVDPTGFFPLDVTTTCRLEVTDLMSMAADGDLVDVTVTDTTDPTLNCPAPITVECTAPGGTPATDGNIAAFLNGATASDICDDTLSISNDAPGFFDLGSTSVTFSTQDDSLNMSMCSASVNVEDTTDPVVSDVTATPSSLWPPNHKMVSVSLDVAVTDVCDDMPVCAISSVTSNEPSNGRGDGNTSPDFLVTAPLEVSLRAERSGRGAGRTYTIEVTCTDGSSNDSSASVEVGVAHDRGR